MYVILLFTVFSNIAGGSCYFTKIQSSIYKYQMGIYETLLNKLGMIDLMQESFTAYSCWVWILTPDFVLQLNGNQALTCPELGTAQPQLVNDNVVPG